METGRSLAHYEIVSRLGAGGMGEVWRARDTKLDRDVALKILPGDFTLDPARRARFQREAQALAAFTHPNVAGIYSIEEEGGTHFLAMELVEGDDLSVRLREGPLPANQALEIASQVALALEAAHQKGIIHRDLKPANIKVDREDQVKVLDFGLAKFSLDGGESKTVDLESSPTITSEVTRTGVILGTAAYMSPEQTRGKVIDKRTDIWAFGCVLFEMLTGRSPFGAETLTDTLASIVRSEPEWDLLPADLHPSIMMLLHRCLKKNPRQRLHDIADVRIVLEDVMSGTDTMIAFVGEAVAGSHRRRVPAAWLGVTALLVIAALAARLWLFAPGTDENPVRLSRLTFSGMDWSPAASPDGQMVAFTSSRDGVPRIWIKQLANGSEAPLTEGVDDSPRFSPDGSQVLYVHDEGDNRDLFRIPLVGGQPRKVLSDVTEADWSPDGSEVAFLRIARLGEINRVSLGIADVQTGTERIVTGIDNRLLYGVRWSPDGRWIAITENALSGNLVAGGQLDLVDPETGDLRRVEIPGLTGSYTAVQWAPGGGSFLVGRTQELLSYITGRPGLCVQYFLDDGRTRPLFWTNFRIPQGGWGYSTLASLNAGQVLLDSYERNAVLQVFPMDGGPPRMVTQSVGFDRQPVYSPDGSRILFSSNRSGNIDLWVVDLATGGLRQVTDDPASDWDPAFSPDGRQILWSSDRSGHMEIWMSNVDGTGARQVTRDGEDAENPTMTADGEWIVYASANDEKLGLWRIRPDGTDAEHLAEGTFLIPEVSPDGRYALFSVIRSMDYVIRVFDLVAGKMTPFTLEIPLVERAQDVVYGRARWTPDGRIAFVSQGPDGNSGIAVQDFDPGGGDTAASRLPLAGFSHHFSTESLGISPDGRDLVVSTVFTRQSLLMADELTLSDWR